MLTLSSLQVGNNKIAAKKARMSALREPKTEEKV